VIDTTSAASPVIFLVISEIMVKVVTTFNFSFASNSKFIKKNRNIIKKFLKNQSNTIPQSLTKQIIQDSN